MYATAARHLLRVLGLEARLVDVTAGAVDRYTAARLAEGASRHTIAKELVTLRGALRGAKRKGEYRADLDEIMPQWSPAYQPRKQWLTPSQVAALLDQLSKRRAAVVAFVVATGARKGEAFRAEWQDVIGTRVHLRGTKTAAANRIVPVVHRECLRFLQIAIAGARAQGPLFDRWRAAHRDLERACRRAGIPRVSWNDLRRTFGSWLKQAGVPLDDIADLLGHTSTTMVRRVYGQDTPQALEQRIRKSLGTTTSQRRSRKSRVRAKKGPKK
jgi:integrase